MSSSSLTPKVASWAGSFGAPITKHPLRFGFLKWLFLPRHLPQPQSVFAALSSLPNVARVSYWSKSGWGSSLARPSAPASAPLHSGKCLLAGFSVVVSPFCPTLLVVVGPSALSTVSDGIFARGVLSVYSISLGRRVLFYLLMCLVGSRYLDFYVLLGPASFVTSIFRF